MELCAGIDEAGRGGLAGPVVAAAVILPPRHNLPGLADSKTLSARKRAELEREISKQALAIGLGLCSAHLIDEINILQATFLAMAKAAASLEMRPRLLLIDGNRPIPEKALEMFPSSWAGRPVRQICLVRGDSRAPAISAASILAKTFRDRLMTFLDRRFPGYGFATHKGYGTRLHLEKIARLGPCRIHRMTFRGVKTDEAL